MSESVVMAQILASYAHQYQVSLTSRELARLTGVNPGTIYRTLTVMVANRILDCADGRYFFGPVLEDIAIAARQRSPEQRTVHILTRLRDATNETVGLTELRAGVKVVVLQVESREELRSRVPVGRAAEITGTASDKLFYAWGLFDSFDDDLPDDLESLSEGELEDLRKSRMCINRGWASGTLTVACLLQTQSSEAMRVLTVSGPAARMQQHGVTFFVRAVQEAADEIALATPSPRRGLPSPTYPVNADFSPH